MQWVNVPWPQIVLMNVLSILGWEMGRFLLRWLGWRPE